MHSCLHASILLIERMIYRKLEYTYTNIYYIYVHAYLFLHFTIYVYIFIIYIIYIIYYIIIVCDILILYIILYIIVLIIVLINMVTIFMMPAKMATLVLLKIRVFWNNDYGIIISIHDVTNNFLSRDSNYIIDVVMWPKFGNCSISMRKVIVTSIL